MACKMCEERGKTWPGDNPSCAFEKGIFDTKNWMCATANAIRDIVSDWQDKFPKTVDYRYCDDQKYATICLNDMNAIEVEQGDIGDDDVRALALWVSWYKSRGRTEAMWLLDEYELPRCPTEKECLKIIEYHKDIE